MKYFPIFQELFESDSIIFMLIGLILLFVGTIAIGGIIGFLLSHIKIIFLPQFLCSVKCPKQDFEKILCACKLSFLFPSLTYLKNPRKPTVFKGLKI